MLIAGSLTIYRQLSYMRNQELGYSKDQMLIVKAPAITDSTFNAKTEYFNLYQDIFPGNAFESFFLDAYFDRQYQSDARFGDIFIAPPLLLMGLSLLTIGLQSLKAAWSNPVNVLRNA